MEDSNKYFQICDMFHASYVMYAIISYDYVCHDKLCYACYVIYAMLSQDYKHAKLCMP